jgi:hypothetical protein
MLTAGKAAVLAKAPGEQRTFTDGRVPGLS